MSVTPSCAITDPSTSSTIEWTIDCGWTSTSMRSAVTSNSHRASITSSPLFISVAESMVIFGPMRHVGMVERVGRRDRRELRRRDARGTGRRRPSGSAA